MKEETNQERLSIRTASKALGVSEKSIARYIERGILTRIKDGHRVYLLSDEVRELRKKRQTESKTHIGQEAKQTVTIPIETYNSLLTELAGVKAKSNYLIEYKYLNEKLSKELDQVKQQNAEVNSWIKEVIKEGKEKDEQVRTQSHSLHKKDEQITELKKNLTELRCELGRVKKRGLFKRILNR